MRTPTSVLFACDTNTVRSVIAEHLAKQRFGNALYFESVGVRAGDAADPFAVAVMAEVGADLSHHKPKAFDQLSDTSFDWIVSLSPSAQHAAVELTRTMACELIFWPTFDATAVRGSRDTILAAFRGVRDALGVRVTEAFGGLPPRATAPQESP